MPRLTTRFRQQLWGLLSQDQGVPLDHLVRLDGADLARATLAFDLWLALVEPLPPWAGEHLREGLARLLATSVADSEGTLSVPRFHLLLLIYRAAVKVAPYPAGRDGFPALCRLVERKQRDSGEFCHRWLGLCWELGVLLKRHADWLLRFETGLRDGAGRVADAPEPLRELLRVSLGEMAMSPTLIGIRTPAERDEQMDALTETFALGGEPR